MKNINKEPHKKETKGNQMKDKTRERVKKIYMTDKLLREIQTQFFERGKKTGKKATTDTVTYECLDRSI